MRDDQWEMLCQKIALVAHALTRIALSIDDLAEAVDESNEPPPAEGQP